jgi:WD40 repeat protein
MPDHTPRPNPYVGPRAFQTGEKLYGRDREARELLDLLIAERIVLLHSPSGAGKSSLVQAGMIPRLQDEGFRLLPVVRVSQEPPAAFKNQDQFNRYAFSVLLSLEEALPQERRTPPENLVALSLDEYLSKLSPAEGSAESTDSQSIVLIFDQFEEVLTINTADRETKIAFFQQLGQALRLRNRWALFVMREDYLPALDPYLRPIPTRLSNTYRLDFLGVEAAHQAIAQPALGAGVEFSRPAVSKLVNDLRMVQVQLPDGSMETRPGPYVEPVQLQVVCSNIWRHIPADKTQILEEDISTVGNVNQSLAEYYAEQVAQTSQQAEVRERRIRDWFDRHLITESGLRGQVLMGAGESDGLSNQAIFLLEDAHLIRAEKRLGATWFELAHDRLIQPVRGSNATWFQEHLSLLQRQAALWVKENRADTLYLRDQALVEAETWAAEHPDELSEIDREFLQDCLEVRAQEQAAREAAERERQLKLEAAEQLAEAEKRRAEEQAKAASRLRRRAYVLAGVLILAIAMAALAFVGQKAARDNAVIANQERATAQAASTLASDNAMQADQNAATARAASILAQENALRAESNAAAAAQAASTAIAAQATAEYNAEVARQQEEIARTQANLARSRELASLALTFLKQNSALTLLLSKEALDVSDTGQALDALLRGLQRNLSRRAEKFDPFIPAQEVDLYAVATSPDGSRLVWGGSDGLMRAWDLVGQKQAWQQFINRGITVKALAYSPDGKTLATGDAGGTLALWNSLNGRRTITFPSSLREINSLAFSPDGTLLAYGGRADGANVNLFIRNLVSGALQSLRIRQGEVGEVLDLAWSPDGSLLASGGRDRIVHIWDAKTGMEIETLNFYLEDNAPQKVYEGPIRSLSFSPNGKWLATGGEDNESGERDKTLQVWDTAAWSDQPPVIFKGGPNENLTSLAFSPDGQTLVSGYNNGTIVTWNFNSQQPNETIKAHNRPITSLDFSQFEDSLLLVSVSPDRTVAFNNLIALSSLGAPLAENKGSPVRLATSTEGSLMIAGTTDSGVTLWDLNPASGAEQQVDTGEGVPQGKFFLSPDGSRLALSPADGLVELREVGSADIITLTVPAAAVNVVDAAGGATLKEENGAVDALAISPDNAWLAGGMCSEIKIASDPETGISTRSCTQNEILIWDLATAKIEKRIPTGQSSPILSLAFNPQNANMIAVGYQDASIQLWEIAAGRLSGLPLVGLGGAVTSLAFHQDGDILASGSANNLIALWNLKPPQLIGDPFIGSDGGVTGLAFSQDNSILYSGTDKGSVNQWDFAAWKTLACDLAERNLNLAEWEQFFPLEKYRAICEQFTLETPAPTPTPGPQTPTPGATGTPTP